MNSPANPSDHISVCVCTYRRNDLLERLLRNLARQQTAGLFDFSVVVVDNDADGPARETVLRLQRELTLNVTYSIEPEHTIPAARNHALRLARGNYIAIIDDDEFPPFNWLLTLYNAILVFSADGVLGPAYAIVKEQPPTWVMRSRLYDRRRHRTGTLLRWHECYTSNVLARKAIFSEHGLTFDTRYATGGSDQAFFRDAIRHGYCFFAVEEAPVYEVMPPERWTMRYFIRRAVVNGYNSRRYTSGGGLSARTLLRDAKSVAAVLGWTLASPVALVFGTHLFVSCAVRAAYHFSRLCAGLNIELRKRRDF